ncbi:MAG: leucine-rich repeat domain-containing protein [Clostridia bacterium]|nr:leucine-rich repeat domain-containing protein [Clostridia bacterium]
MKKTAIIIVSLTVAIVLTALILVTTIIAPKFDEWFGSDDTTYNYSYSMVPTATIPVVPQDTESWVDINAIAGDLATATDTDTSSTSVTLAPVVIGTEGGSALTTIIYIDQNGNIIDPNLVNNNKTTTYIENDNAFDDTVAATDDNSFAEYEINSAGVITRYFGTSKVVMIPSKIQGITVKGIGKGCFESLYISGVQIPETVTVIEAGAFKDCKYLKTVVFKDEKASVKIGNSAFKGCTSLESINLPITPEIGLSAFESCTSLKKLDIKAGTKNIGQYCFAYCESLTALTIRDDKTTFNGITTFQGCNKGKLIVYCEVDSDVEFTMKEYGLNTSPITG